MSRHTAAQRPVIGYTLGEQAGVGPELLERVLAELRREDADFIPMGRIIPCTPGQPTEATAHAAWEQLEAAAEALRGGRIDAVVTAPVRKAALQSIGFPFPGQTEFFAERLGVQKYAMCLTGEHLTVGLCTTHIPLAEVPGKLTSACIENVAELLCDFLRKQGREHPRLAVAGLNPHNGEEGAFGSQELQIIAPAVAALQKRFAASADICGPCVPDCVYRDAAAGIYDAVVAPYHDQALIPLKLLDFDNGVNVTLGLPRLRLSPDHGTAFSLAGRGIASHVSMRRAFLLALQHLRAPDRT